MGKKVVRNYGKRERKTTGVAFLTSEDADFFIAPAAHTHVGQALVHVWTVEGCAR